MQRGGGLVSRAAPYRVGQWWSFKLVPPLVASYVSCLTSDQAIAGRWLEIVVPFVTLASGAAAISVINDMFDVVDDRAAGKLNRLEGKSAGLVALLLLPHLVIATAAVAWWHHQPAILAVYGATWLAFGLYSIPPVRLKRRGSPGALADASGANLLPALLATWSVGGVASDPVLSIVIAAWAGLLGLRGIVWHQLEDFVGDQCSGTATYVVRASPAAARRMIKTLVFPLELTALGAIIWLASAWTAAVALIFYLRTVVPMKRHYGRQVRAIAGDSTTEPILYDYYLVLMPLALVIESAIRHPADLLVAALQVTVFAGAILSYATQLRHWTKR